MNEYRKTATDYFLQGYSCSQSVILTFAEELGLDRDTANAVSAPFGGGIGRLREVCGAVSGMMFALGAFYGPVQPNETDKKKDLYKDVQKLADLFKDKNGSIICRDLLGLEGRSEAEPEARTPEYYKKRKTCIDKIGDAAELFGTFLDEHRHSQI